VAAARAVVDGRSVQLAGMAKGSGMIEPNMATMLAVLVTDAALTKSALDAALRRAVARSFNRLTVDGDTSTNDTYLAFAAGEPLSAEHFEALETGLTAVSQHLAKAIARDGEGATCLIEVQVEGASDDAAARAIARTICGSSLVKCAVHGRDPNWGRIVAAIGRTGAAYDPNRIRVEANGLALFANGAPAIEDLSALERVFSSDRVEISIDLAAGRHADRFLTCDLTAEYVRINAEYTT